MCLIERDDGARLFVRHSYRRRWGVPGGLLNRGEDVRDAARREAMEEVGLDVELVGEPTVVVEPRSRRVDVIFAARPAPGADLDDVAPRSPEIDECRWFAARRPAPAAARDRRRARGAVAGAAARAPTGSWA